MIRSTSSHFSVKTLVPCANVAQVLGLCPLMRIFAKGERHDLFMLELYTLVVGRHNQWKHSEYCSFIDDFRVHYEKWTKRLKQLQELGNALGNGNL